MRWMPHAWPWGLRYVRLFMNGKTGFPMRCTKCRPHPAEKTIPNRIRPEETMYINKINGLNNKNHVKGTVVFFGCWIVVTGGLVFFMKHLLSFSCRASFDSVKSMGTLISSNVSLILFPIAWDVLMISTSIRFCCHCKEVIKGMIIT